MSARPRRRRRAAPKPRLKKWLRRQDRFTRGLLVAVAALSVLIVSLIVPRLSEERRDTIPARHTSLGSNGSQTPARRPPRARMPASSLQRKAEVPQPLPPAASTRSTRIAVERSSGPRAAIVIDDLGQNISHLERLADLNIPLSIAVIPGLPASSRTVGEASQRGIEVLLHQPMEPREESGKNPGAGVLLTSMSAQTLRAQVRANLAAVPGAVGVNNHMGSRFTENYAGLLALMAELKMHGLFWLDSRTTSATRGVEAAHAVGVPALERDIFLDSEVNVDFIRRQIRKLVETARDHGTAIGIGHPHLETIAVLRELRGELLASGVTLVPLSRLVTKIPDIEPGTAIAAARTGRSGAGEPPASRKTATP